VQEKSNGKNAKFPAARIVDGVVKSIIVEKVIHTKFMAYRDKTFHIPSTIKTQMDLVLQMLFGRLGKMNATVFCTLECPY
jgi:hypothetical protein